MLTPLHVAALNGNHEIAAFLVENGANVNSRDKDGRTVMHHAALGNNAKMIEVMIQHVSTTSFQSSVYNIFIKDLAEAIISYSAVPHLI